MARTLRLFIDEEPDTEIVLRLGCPMAEYFGYLDRWEARREQPAAALLDLLRDWGNAGYIESWTYPQPTTGDGLVALDWPVPLVILGRWFAEVGNVPAPLLVTASGGTLSTPEADPAS